MVVPQVLMKIALDQEEQGKPASPVKRKLSSRALAEALRAQASARLDRRYGIKGLPLMSLEELVCLVHLACKRPSLAVKVGQAILEP